MSKGSRNSYDGRALPDHLPEESTAQRDHLQGHAGAASALEGKRQVKTAFRCFTQIIGLQVRTFDRQEQDRIAQALSKSDAVLLKNTGALCCGANEEDATAVAMILQKSAKALIGASLFGKVRPINRFESMLMRFVYLKKYAKQAYAPGAASRRQ